MMEIAFEGKIIYWRGPAPWYFVAVPEAQSREIKAIARLVTYGWGVIPVRAQIGTSEWETSLFPKDGRYLAPIKTSVRKAQDLYVGDEVKIRLELAVGSDERRFSHGDSS